LYLLFALIVLLPAVTEDLPCSIEFNVKPELDVFQSTSPIWEVDLIDFNTPDWKEFLATDPICQ